MSHRAISRLVGILPAIVLGAIAVPVSHAGSTADPDATEFPAVAVAEPTVVAVAILSLQRIRPPSRLRRI